MKLETEAGRRKVDEPLSNSLEFNIKRSQSLIVKYLAKPTYEEAIVKGKMKEAQRRESDRKRDLKMERKIAAE